MLYENISKTYNARIIVSSNEYAKYFMFNVDIYRLVSYTAYITITNHYILFNLLGDLNEIS
jgi:hypothetical protein